VRKHHHLLGRGVLRFVEDDEGVGKRAAAHVGEGGDFDRPLLHEAGDILGREHVVHGVIKRPEVGQDFFAQIPGRKPNASPASTAAG